MLAILLAGPALSATLHAQEVFLASWSIQDLSRGLRQKLAEDIIERANDWLTRENPNAPTARTDALLRVTIVGELSGAGGGVHPRLHRLVLGTIAIDTSFNEFLDPATIASLERRDQYWCDESIVVYNQALSPIAAPPEEDLDSSALEYERTFAAPRRPRLRLALDESSVRITPDLHLWAGLGYEEIALPGVSFGRVRAGVSYNQLKIWGELPAPIGNKSNAILARGLEGGAGLGVSFEKHGLGRIVSGVGGAVSVAGADTVIGTPAAADDEGHYLLSKAALLYGILPIRLDLFGGATMQVKLGLGYTQASVIPTGFDGSTADTGAFRLLARAEFASLAPEGYHRRIIAAQLFGKSVMASWQEQLTPSLGFKITGAAHGLFGERAPYLPSYTISFTPIFSIW